MTATVGLAEMILGLVFMFWLDDQKEKHMTPVQSLFFGVFGTGVITFGFGIVEWIWRLIYVG